MILSSINELSRYESTNPNFKAAFKFLQTTDLASLSGEKIVLDGEKMFVKLANTELVPAESGKLEVHNKYIDIQVPVSAEEIFGWANRNTLKEPKAEFNETRDLQFYADKPTSFIRVVPGECIIFFPEDAHAPLIGEGTIQKVIIKVAI
jgi:YhcH/YjgK/YiaL family protein